MERYEIENDVLEMIAEQVKEGYYSGLFDYNYDEDKYVSVSWSLDVDIDDVE